MRLERKRGRGIVGGKASALVSTCKEVTRIELRDHVSIPPKPFAKLKSKRREYLSYLVSITTCGVL